MTDENGEAVWSGEVTPFADSEKTTDDEEHVLFTGKEFEPETGLYYFNARWYDSNTGRFTTEDPIRDGINWFIYAGNNPLRFVDPTGLINTIVAEGSGFPDIHKTYIRKFESYFSDIDPKYTNLDTMIVTDLNTGKSITIEGVQTVANSPNGKFTDTIAPGKFQQLYKSTTPVEQIDNPVLVNMNAETIGANSINSKGETVSPTGEIVDYNRSLEHANIGKGMESDYPLTTSKNCIILDSESFSEEMNFYEDVGVPSGIVIEAELKVSME